jgi:hypothetical protein
MTPRRGTTLLELVVALVVTGAVAATGAAAFRHLALQREVATFAARGTERAAARRALFAEWLDHAVIESPAESRQVPSGDGAARGEGDALFFRTNVVLPAVPTGARVRLYVDVDPATPERGLALEFRRAPDLPFERRALDATVRSLTIEFQDVRSRRWIAAPDADTVRAVAVRLRLPYDATLDARLAALPITFSMVRDETSTLGSSDADGAR